MSTVAAENTAILGAQETLGTDDLSKLSDSVKEKTTNIIDLLSDDQARWIFQSSDKIKNICLLGDIMKSKSKEDEDYVSDKVITNALGIVFILNRQPMIFRTHRNSIQMEYEQEDQSYLEFEIYENRITCMNIPKGVADKAMFPDVSLNNLADINKIVEDFYGNK